MVLPPRTSYNNSWMNLPCINIGKCQFKWLELINHGVLMSESKKTKTEWAETTGNHDFLVGENPTVK